MQICENPHIFINFQDYGPYMEHCLLEEALVNWLQKILEDLSL